MFQSIRTPSLRLYEHYGMFLALLGLIQLGYSQRGGVYRRSRRDELTTVTDDRAMAAPATSYSNRQITLSVHSSPLNPRSGSVALTGGNRT